MRKRVVGVVAVAVMAAVFLGGCAGFRADLVDANAAAIASLEESIVKLPPGSKERENLQKALDEMKRAQATGFDPVAMVLAFAGNHSEALYGAAGLGIIGALLAAWKKRGEAAGSSA